ncbi:MAG: hypothetical protein QXN83_10395 [Nitrososphaerales archaeon]
MGFLYYAFLTVVVVEPVPSQELNLIYTAIGFAIPISGGFIVGMLVARRILTGIWLGYLCIWITQYVFTAFTVPRSFSIYDFHLAVLYSALQGALGGFLGQ